METLARNGLIIYFDRSQDVWFTWSTVIFSVQKQTLFIWGK